MTGYVYDSLPSALKEQRSLVLWKKQSRRGKLGKFDKIPHYIDGTRRYGLQGSDTDRAKLGTFQQAVDAYQAAPDDFAGIGIAMLPDSGLVCLDFDGCIDDEGVVEKWVLDICASTYYERSPSGRGVRAIFLEPVMDLYFDA